MELSSRMFIQHTQGHEFDSSYQIRHGGVYLYSQHLVVIAGGAEVQSHPSLDSRQSGLYENLSQVNRWTHKKINERRNTLRTRRQQIGTVSVDIVTRRYSQAFDCTQWSSRRKLKATSPLLQSRVVEARFEPMQFDFKELLFIMVSSYELLIQGSGQALIRAAEMDHFRPAGFYWLISLLHLL